MLNYESKIEDFETSLYEQLCQEWIVQERQLKEQKAHVEKLRSKLIDLAGGERMEFGVKIQKVNQKGRTDYKAIVEDSNVDQDIIDAYTGSPVEVWKVTKY